MGDVSPIFGHYGVDPPIDSMKNGELPRTSHRSSMRRLAVSIPGCQFEFVRWTGWRNGLARSSNASKPGSSGFRGLPGWMTAT